MKTFILKIGGSSITRKDENRLEARTGEIRRIAREIKGAKKGNRLVVVHGAGPFGHKMVADYGINSGVSGSKGIEGFVRTHNSMEDLNKTVMDAFRDEGLLGFPVQPSACITQEDRRIVSFDDSIIKGLLELSPEIIPIMYGDMVLDSKLGASVVSGDAIVPYLAKSLEADRVFMGTDVDGIFDADPKLNPDAKLIERIGPGNYETVMKTIGEATTVDVTQGMKGKLMKMFEQLHGISVLIYNIGGKDNTFKALSGQRIKCTEIEF